MRGALLIAASLVGLLLAACRPAQEDGARVLTYATPYAATHPFSRADQTWMAFVEERSGGALRVKPFWSGSLLSSDQSLWEIRHGVADIGLVTPIYARGGAHLVRTQSGFYGGVSSIDDQIAVYKCLAQEFPQIRREMAGLKVLAIQGGNFPGLVTRERRVTRLEDLRGLRLRVPTELNPVLRKLGADPVDMPMGEVYSAMAKGVIDGVVAPTDTLRSLHFGEVAKYFTTVHVSRGAYPARAMSAETWESLSPDLRGVLDESQAVWEAALEAELTRAAEVGADYAEEVGIEFLPFDAEDQARFDAVYNESALEEARRLERFDIDAEPVFRRAQALIAGASCGAGAA